MANAVLVFAYIALPVATWLVLRSMAKLVLGIAVIVTLSGALVQSTVVIGVPWTLSGLQWLLFVDLVGFLAFAIWLRTRAKSPTSPPLAQQFGALWLPAIVIGILFLGFRLMASPDPGTLAGIGFLVSHPGIEDSAKWMNLAAQMVTGQSLDFVGGYAGGPLLLILAAMATLLSLLSNLFLGGINEVAVVVGTFIGSSFLLAVLSPFALAPLTQMRFSNRRRHASGSAPHVPAPLLWMGALVLATGSTVLISLGHLSMQLVLLMLTLWVATFLANGSVTHGRVLASVVAVGAAVVWFPLNGLSIVLMIAMIGWLLTLIMRFARGVQAFPWVVLALVATSVIAFWEAVVSSTLYVIGFGQGEIVATGGAAAGAVSALARGGLTALPTNVAQLFNAPGGTEQLTSLLTLLAGLGVLGAAVLLTRSGMAQRRLLLAFAPIGSLIAYLALIGTTDATLTGLAPNYATLKLGFGVGVALASATLPLAVMSLDWQSSGMTLLRWSGVGVVVFLLVADGLLPRAVNTVSPTKWPTPAEGTSPYWAAIEVRPTPSQPLAALPIACAFLPPEAEVPSAMPTGELAYGCTRLLIGLSGKEGKDGAVLDWIAADWSLNGQLWDPWHPNLVGSPDDIRARQILLLGNDANVIGLEPLQGLLDRYPPRVPQ